MASILSIALNPAIDISGETDRVQNTHKTRVHNQRQEAGGGGINVARVISELGGECDLLYLSGGETGILLQAILDGLGLFHRPVSIDGAVRMAFNVQELSTHLEYRFVPDGPLVDEAELEPVFDAIRHTQADYIVASGSLPRGVPDETYGRLAEIAAAHGRRFVLDTSGPALKAAIGHGKPFLIKPSISELEALIGHPLASDEIGPAARDLVARGAADNVAVTLGSDGALLAGETGVLRLPAIDVPVSSAVGAGDSFVGAMVWSLAQGHELEEAFRFGLSAGAAAVMTPGTRLCRRDDIFTLFKATFTASDTSDLPA